MHSPDLLRVSRGLALAHWGFRLIAAGVIIVTVVFAVVTGHYVSDRPAQVGLSDLLYAVLFLLLMGFWIIASPIVAGILLGTIGRVFCLRTPPELPTARARIRLAVLLEGCGLLSAVVTGGVAAVANGAGPIRLAYEVLYAVLLFAVVMFAARRAFFYAFSGEVARAVDAKPAPRPSALTVTLILTASMASFVGFLLTGTRSPADMLTGGGAAFVVTLCVFGTLYVYGRHLRRLRAAVKQFNTRPADAEAECS